MGLAAETSKAVAWNYAGTGVRSALAMALTIVLSRLLGPQPFGIIAAATAVIGLGSLLRDVGLGPALIHAETLSVLDVRSAFTMQSTLGLCLWVACSLAAPALGRGVHSSDFVPVLRVLGATFFIQALGGASASLLARELRYRKVQQVQIVAYAVGYAGVGLPCALARCGVWSLVAAQLTQSVVFAVLMLRSYPVPLRPSWKWAGSCEIYGLKVFGTNLLNWIISNADTVCISASVGIPNLGLYNRVQALTVLPLGAVLSSVNTVLFSAYSRKQSDPGAIARVYLGVTGGFCTCVFPLYAGLAAIPALTVTSVFGAKYQSAAIVFAPAALISCTMCLIAAAGPVLWALNRVEQELLSAAVFAPTLILILAFFSGGSLRGVAYCMLGVFVARALVATALVVRCLHLSVRDIWDVWYPGIILSACTFVASKCSSALLHRVFASQIIVFLLVAGFTGGTGALLVIFFPRAFVPTVTLQRISGWALGPRSSVIAAVRGFAFRLSRAR